jgi:outer membrane protein
MFRLSIPLFLIVLLPAAASAVDSPAAPRRVSLESAIRIALRENRALMAAGFADRAALDHTGVALGAMVPRLDAGENLSYTNNPVQVFSDLLLQQDFNQSDFSLDSLNHPGFLSNFQSQITLSFPLFAGGRLIAAYRAAGFAAAAERWRLLRTRQTVEFEVMRSYYGAVLAEERLAVVDRALTAARAHLRQANDLFQHGMVVNSDVLRTNVLVGGLEQERIQAESRLKIAWATLANVLGVDDAAVAPVVKSPTEVPPTSVDRLDALLAHGSADRPEIKIAAARMEQARQAVAMARAEYWPTIQVAGVYENDSESLSRAGNNGAVMLAGRLNLFNGLATKSKVDAARAEFDRARVLADDLRRSVRLEIETAYRTLLAADQQLDVARRDTIYANRALNVLEDRYGSGLATNVAVLDAQASREQTDLQLVAAQVGVEVDRAALNLATGQEPESFTGR